MVGFVRLAVGGAAPGLQDGGVLASRHLDTVSGQAASLDPVSAWTLPGKPRFGGVFCFSKNAAERHFGQVQKQADGDFRSLFAFGEKRIKKRLQPSIRARSQ
ncbi:hypothetical protein EN873_19885 [bacterium M00.F.Ca.ET.230.01.1.1]|nr:hypothetical protein EN873_19885 [bacterium M00.F.Ca.ET.230.01.1.1]